MLENMVGLVGLEPTTSSLRNDGVRQIVSLSACILQGIRSDSNRLAASCPKLHCAERRFDYEIGCLKMSSSSFSSTSISVRIPPCDSHHRSGSNTTWRAKRTVALV